MDFIIFVRQKLNWSEMTPEKFYSQGSKSTVWKIFQTGIDVLSIWNTLFTTKYFEYRNQLSIIASEQNAKLGCRILRGQEEIMQELKSSNDAYILPTDDDDFFNPNVFNIPDNKGVVVWPEGWLQHNKIFKARLPQKYVGTNCYAIKKSFVLNHIGEENWFRILRHHGSVSRILCPNCSREKFIEHVDWTEQPYSVSNRHMGTVTLLQEVINKHKNVKRIQEVISNEHRKCFDDLTFLDEYSWFVDAATKLIEFYKSISYCNKVVSFL